MARPARHVMVWRPEVRKRQAGKVGLTGRWGPLLQEITMRTAELEVGRLSAGWRHLPPVHVVPTAAHLPIPAPADAAGLFHRGEIFVVGDQPVRQVPRVLAHECAHWGGRAELAARWPDFMQAVNAGARAGDPLLVHARGMVRQAYVDESGARYLRPALEADEVISAVAELAMDSASGSFAVPRPWRSLAALHFGRVARDRFFADVPACRLQVLGLLVAVEHRLRHGGAFWGTGRRLRGWYAAAMTKPWDPRSAPMSLRESESLLAAEAYKMKAREEWKAMGMIGVGLVSLLVFLASLAYLAVWIFGGLAHFFR